MNLLDYLATQEQITRRPQCGQLALLGLTVSQKQVTSQTSASSSLFWEMWATGRKAAETCKAAWAKQILTSLEQRVSDLHCQQRRTDGLSHVLCSGACTEPELMGWDWDGSSCDGRGVRYLTHGILPVLPNGLIYRKVGGISGLAGICKPARRSFCSHCLEGWWKHKIVTCKPLKSWAVCGFPHTYKPLPAFRKEKRGNKYAMTNNCLYLHQLQPKGQQLTTSSGPRN